jgi:hypothetical protein
MLFLTNTFTFILIRHDALGEYLQRFYIYCLPSLYLFINSAKEEFYNYLTNFLLSKDL